MHHDFRRDDCHVGIRLRQCILPGPLFICSCDAYNHFPSLKLLQLQLSPEDMSTLTVTDLESHLGGLKLDTPIPRFPTANVLNKPLDISRSYFADILCTLTGCDPAVAYNSIQWPNNISNGDLVVILPKLSQGADYNALGFDITRQVWKTLSDQEEFNRKGQFCLIYSISFQNAHSSCFLSQTAYIFGSC
jgi:hypothetical protein